MFRKKVDSEINLILVHELLAEEFFKIIDSNREYLGEWLPWPPFIKGVEDQREFIKKSLIDYAHGKSMVCAVEYLGEIGGAISFHSILHELKKTEIGYWLASEYQGKGIMHRCCKYLINYAFEELDMDKIEIKVIKENIKSHNVCKKLGFELEGTITNSGIVNGKIIDLAVYGFHKRNR